jgi:hypothetical protein
LVELGNEEIKDDFTRIDPVEDDPAEDKISILRVMFDYGKSFVKCLINGTAWSEEAKTAVQSMAVDECSWRELTGASSFTFSENLEKFTVVAHEPFDICWEGWRKPDTDLSFVHLDDGRQFTAAVGVYRV